MSQRFAFFYHSVISDWNHGNAHFLRGLMRALQERGHATVCYEQADNWSLKNLLRARPRAIAEFQAQFPDLRFSRYSPREGLDACLREAVAAADVVLVHEWNEPAIIRRLGELGRQLGVRTVFHDTHYRVVLDPAFRQQIGLDQFDDILAFSPSIAQRYLDLGLPPGRVHVLHEAADISVFGPRPVAKSTDVVFVGNYGDGDRSDEIEQFIFGPRTELPDLRYAIYGVRYPARVISRMRNGLAVDFRGWVANTDVPEVYSAAKVVLHVPRRQYVELLPGTPTIRVFEALASGACLVSLPWPDTDGLFRTGTDFSVVRTPSEMRDTVRWLASDASAREAFGHNGRQSILARHTCGHRAEELLRIVGA